MIPATQHAEVRMDLIRALWKYLIAKGEEDGKRIYHFLLADGDVLEIVL
jgi:hypothetical protein